MTVAESHTVRLELLTCGDPFAGAAGAARSRRPPVLFVHGAYCGAWIWGESFLPYFCRHGFPARAVSLRGHGGSEGDVTWASLADYVDDVEAAAERIGEPPILIGHSMGGLVVQHFLARGHKVRAAVLMSSVPPSGLAGAAMHMSMFAPTLLWQLGLLQSLGPGSVSPQTIHDAFFSAATPALKVAHLLPRMQRESQRIATELLAPAQPRPPDGPDRPPILVIGGDADVFLPTNCLRESATYFDGDLIVLKGAPHGLMLDTAWWQPAADTVIGWLDTKVA